MKLSTSWILVGLILVGCAGKKIRKVDWSANTGKLRYHNYKGVEKEQFLTEAKKYIHCKEAFQDISKVSYDSENSDGEFMYMCVTYDRHCRHGNAKSCLIKGLEYLKTNPSLATSFFQQSCQQHSKQGCYMAGVFTQGPSRLKFFETACTLGHNKACHETDLIEEPLTVSDQLTYIDQYIQNDQALTTASGLAYTILKHGNKKRPGMDSTVKVHYEGKLTDGTVFDSSYRTGQPIELSLASVIMGWREGLQLVGEGGRIQLVIPSALGYGSRGAPPHIPGGATLIFDIELIEVN